MTPEEREEMLKKLLASGKVNIGQLSVGDHNTLNYYEKDKKANEDSKEPLTKKELGLAIKAVQGMFWGNSSYAVIFCAARDLYHHSDNYTLFEDDVNEAWKEFGLEYPCPPNTIASTFYNNNYLKLNIDKWEDNNVKPRSLQLVKAFENAVVELRKKQNL